MYYHVYSSTLPPEAAYRIIPEGKDIVTINLKWAQEKKANRRKYFHGWSNWTDFEVSFLRELKSQMLKRHKIDLNHVKPFGPRGPPGFCRIGTNAVVSGRDLFLHDYELLKFAVARTFNME